MEHWWNNSDKTPNTWVKKPVPVPLYELQNHKNWFGIEHLPLCLEAKLTTWGPWHSLKNCSLLKEEIMRVSTGLLITFIRWYMCTYVECFSQKKTCSLQ
jgi:hypothetical protein